MSHEWSHVGVRLTGSLRRRLEDLSAERSTSLSDLVRRGVQIYLSGGAEAWEARELQRVERQSGSAMIPAVDPEVRICGEWLQSLPDAVRSYVLKIGSALEACEDVQHSQARWYEYLKLTPVQMWYAELRPPLALDRPEAEQIASVFKNSRILECSESWARYVGAASAQSLLGASLDEIYEREDDGILAVAREFLRSGYRIENRLLETRVRSGRPQRTVSSLIGTIEAGLMVGIWAISQPVPREPDHAEQASMMEADR